MTEILNLRLKIIFYIHFIFVVWVTIGRWCPLSYLFYNAIIILVLLWAIHSNESSEPIQLAILINVTAIIFDVVLLSLRYPADHSGSGEHFSAAMAILNLILRPFTTILLYRILQERRGSMGPLENVVNIFNSERGVRDATSYADIEKHQTLPSVSQNEPSFYNAM